MSRSASARVSCSALSSLCSRRNSALKSLTRICWACVCAPELSEAAKKYSTLAKPRNEAPQQNVSMRLLSRMLIGRQYDEPGLCAYTGARQPLDCTNPHPAQRSRIGRQSDDMGRMPWRARGSGQMGAPCRSLRRRCGPAHPPPASHLAGYPSPAPICLWWRPWLATLRLQVRRPSSHAVDPSRRRPPRLTAPATVRGPLMPSARRLMTCPAAAQVALRAGESCWSLVLKLVPGLMASLCDCLRRGRPAPGRQLVRFSS